MPVFRKVGIVSRVDRTDAVNLAVTIAKFIEKKGLAPVFEADLARLISKKGVRLDKLVADLIVIVGGDGTILRTVHAVKSGIPLFSVNMGTIGFLADVSKKNAYPAVEKILRGDFIRENCFTIRTNLGLPFALNEVRVGSDIPQQMVEMSLLINGKQVVKDKLDAIIVATSTGSSAYALSAGANIVDPRLEALSIVPVCPFSSNFKPLIIPSTQEVSVKILSKAVTTILIDGQSQRKILSPKEIKIKRSSKHVTFLRLKDNFYERLRRRLGTSSL
ncbi:MAG: NAD(+)/NADH kinase [Candidatus Bathyarchaeota archaeon]